jgi:outer membrane protein
VFVWAGIRSFAQTTRYNTKINPAQCIQIALKNNADVQHGQITSGISKTNWQGSKGYMIPTLNGDASHGVNTGRNIDPYTNTYANQTMRIWQLRFNTSLTLFNMFAVYSAASNKINWHSRQVNLKCRTQKIFIALNVILQNLQILNHEDLLSVSMQQQDVSANKVERLDILNQEGQRKSKASCMTLKESMRITSKRFVKCTG